MKEFTNRVAVVTGAASGIGRAMAKIFLENEKEAFFRKVYETYIERGLDPAEVARQVLEAVREERFYVITHDFNDMIEPRMQNVLAAANPEILPPPQGFKEIDQELISSSGGQ